MEMPSTAGHLPGRTSARHAIETAIKRGGDVEPRVVVVVGDAGMGKSALLDVVLHDAVDRGQVALRGGAGPLDLTRPFAPLLDALGAHLTLPVPFPDAGRRWPLASGPAERALVIETITAAVADLATAPGGAMVIVDDLHWAESATLAALDRLAELTVDTPLSLIVALRPSPRSEELHDLLGRWRNDGAAFVELGPLDNDAVAEVLQHQTGAPAGPLLLALGGRLGGSPFEIVELVGELRRNHRLIVEDGIAEVSGAPSNSVVAPPLTGPTERVAALDPATRAALQAGAVVGTSLQASDLASVLGLSLQETRAHLNGAVAAGLLVGPEPFRFPHDLVREAVQDTLRPDERQRLEGAIARSVAAQGQPTRAAAHYLQAGRHAESTAVSTLRAAAAALSNRAPSVAADLLDRAIELASADHTDHDDLLVELIEARFWAGQNEAVFELAESALARSVPPAVATRLHDILARSLVIVGRPGDAVVHAEALAAGASTDADRAWALGIEAMLRLFALDLDGARRQGRHAVALAEAADAVSALVLALSALSWVEQVQARHADAAQFAARAAAAADASDDQAGHRLVPNLFLGLAEQGTGRTAEAVATLRRGQELADRLGTFWATPFFHYGFALTHWEAGRWDDALAECGAGRRFAHHHDIALAEPWACAVSAAAHLFCGRREPAGATLAEGEARLATAGIQLGADWLLWVRALLVEHDGDSEEALGLLELGFRGAEGLQLRSSLTVLAPDLVRLAVAHGRVELASEVVAALDRADDGVHPAQDAHRLRCRGLLDGSPEEIRAARTLHEELGSPVETALDNEALALVLAGARRDPTAARSALRTCVDAHAASGAFYLGERAARACARQGLELRGRPTRRGPLTGVESLTGTERLVADLVATGISNTEIGRELGISRRTVESHLRRVFVKLEVMNRTQLTASLLRA